MTAAASVLTMPRRAQRCLDLALALPAVIVLAPLLAALMVWLKLDSRGPVFFRQTRVGRGGRGFRIFKLRTMAPVVTDAEACGAQLTVGADPRITRAGRLLRRAKLDELPQLFNVIKGEMALVGPRPETPRYTALYDAAQQAILAYTPGITSPASLQFRRENDLLAAQADPEKFYLTEVMPEKIRIDLAYAQRATVLSDLAVIGKTLAHLFG